MRAPSRKGPNIISPRGRSCITARTYHSSREPQLENYHPEEAVSHHSSRVPSKIFGAPHISEVLSFDSDFTKVIHRRCSGCDPCEFTKVIHVRRPYTYAWLPTATPVLNSQITTVKSYFEIPAIISNIFLSEKENGPRFASRLQRSSRVS